VASERTNCRIKSGFSESGGKNQSSSVMAKGPVQSKTEAGVLALESLPQQANYLYAQEKGMGLKYKEFNGGGGGGKLGYAMTDSG